MTSVVQRVKEASVSIDGEVYSKISKGLLILLGICKGDISGHAEVIAKKIIDLRIFSDESDKMNLCVRDIEGEVLVISQFTLCSDKAKSGNRPSFVNAELPDKANALYEELVKEMKNYYIPDRIKTGVFAAKMEVKLINDGPVTIILDK
ncbi:MAG: D-tyrosyl-tRNA(Tyr) deacylase [Ignavibacteria bacterium]|nr:D-tyrosyl-tRNA(Tyr) deacylase [Ignavibacteria bacterium]